jgi:hypothetical protein
VKAGRRIALGEFPLEQKSHRTSREALKPWGKFPQGFPAVGKKIEEFQRPIAEAAKAEGVKEGGKQRHSLGGISPQAKKQRNELEHESKRTSSVAAAAAVWRAACPAAYCGR